MLSIIDHRIALTDEVSTVREAAERLEADIRDLPLEAALGRADALRGMAASPYVRAAEAAITDQFTHKKSMGSPKRMFADFTRWRTVNVQPVPLALHKRCSA